ncbi:hypothetical protein [Nesterenkonia pannonica]|uniref:carbohydrate-binding protein n=1 Tax=Nesterenkonia pannonica TaxID=1548602 RepID=UPI0021649CA5|nr:carbohydrate-binding protein [Nesterenkonia pannonica]
MKPEVDPDTGETIYPPFNRPSGQHDAYNTGMRMTWTDGEVYEAKRDGVVHSPDEYADDWKLIEPESESEPDEDDEPDDDESESGEPATEAWEANVDYSNGDALTYEGELYFVIQDHTSQAHWPPNEVASLYERQ